MCWPQREVVRHTWDNTTAFQSAHSLVFVFTGGGWLTKVSFRCRAVNHCTHGRSFWIALPRGHRGARRRAPCVLTSPRFAGACGQACVGPARWPGVRGPPADAGDCRVVAATPGGDDPREKEAAPLPRSCWRPPGAAAGRRGPAAAYPSAPARGSCGCLPRLWPFRSASSSLPLP